MIRIAGCVLVAGGCIGLGLFYRNRIEERIRNLILLSRILEIMESEVRYSRASLSECCLKLSERIPDPYGGCFLRIFRESQENRGISYGEIVQKYLTPVLEETSLGETEKNLFMDTMRSTGYEDIVLQIGRLSNCKEQIERILEKVQREAPGNRRTAVGLGILSGFFLIIVLL